MKSKLLFPSAFILITIAEIYSDLKGYTELVYLSKPLILISLILFTITSNQKSSIAVKSFFIPGLFFALLGDILLMIRGVDLFAPGLASFLVMQLLYIRTFRADLPTAPSSSSSVLAFLPFLLYAVTLYTLLFPHLIGPIMPVAVAIYALSIAVMGWMAWLRRKVVNTISFQWVFFGALLFMFSDTCIAINKFLMPIPYNTFWVMSTYAAAQFLITLGLLKTEKAGISAGLVS